MSVLLRASNDLPAAESYVAWACVADAAQPSALDLGKRMLAIGAALEQAFDASAEDWWVLARELGREPSAVLAHMPACAANTSDFGIMLAWTRLVDRWAADSETTLVVCDDPWLFRHLRTRTGVHAGRPPPIWQQRVTRWLRGIAARSAAALRVALSALRSGPGTAGPPDIYGALLVYGHPASDAAGIDGYFGRLLQDVPTLVRMLHVDCPPARAKQLKADGRSYSLHGWGNPLFAITLPFVRWRPSPKHHQGQDGWLVRRAAAHEGATGQAAMIRWQIHCQERWLRRCRPHAVSWPWENHSWERAFVRTARVCGVATIGYQHSVIGRQMLNYAPASNPDGLDSIPDRVFCNGEATRDQLAGWRIPAERLMVAGALRFPRVPTPTHTADAPVFVALPFDRRVAGEMVEAVRTAAGDGRSFLIKDHPMTPFRFADGLGVRRTTQQLGDQEAVSAVIYAATTVGLEAVLAGLPTLRFRPKDRIALDILPYGVKIPAVDADSLDKALENPQPPQPVPAERVFAPVDMALWRSALQPA